MPKTRKTKKSFLSFELLLIALLSLAALGCASGPSKEQLTAKLYQPSFLFLKKGQPIQTQEGIYNPQLNEKWVALWEYQKLENEVLILNNALKKRQLEQDIKK